MESCTNWFYWVENLSSKDSGKKNDQSRVAQTSGISFTISPFFIISILCAIVGVGILTFLIFMIPNYPRSSFTSSANTLYDSFFYDVEYRTSSWLTTYYTPRAFPGTGYLILMPFAMILIAISGIGFLVRNRKEAKRMIFINWALYLVPIGMAIAKDVYNNYDYWDSLTQPLGFFPVYLCIFLQFSLLLDKNSFLDWAGFSEESKAENDRFNLVYRRVISIIFLVIFTYAFGIPIFGPYTQKVYYMVFGHVWTAIPIFISWLLFGEVIRISISRMRQRRRVMDYIVNNYVGKSELSIPIIAEYAEISLSKVRTVILKEIGNGRILGEISEDGTILSLLDPNTYFKKQEKPIEEVEPRVIKEFETEPYLFWVSVALSVIAVGTLTVAICFIPIIDPRLNGDVSGFFSNFFYRWEYRYSVYSDYSYLRWVKPHIGAAILLSISVFAQTIAGLCFLVRNRKDSKKLIYINWLLYLIPIVASIVIAAIGLLTLSNVERYGMDIVGMPIILSFFYLTPFVFMQGSMFVLDNTFSEWSSFKGEKAQKLRPIRAGRMVSAIFFFLIFAWMWFYPIGLIIPVFDTFAMHLSHTSVYFAILAWWLFGDLVGIIALKARWKKTIERTIKMGIYELESISTRFDIPIETTLEVAHILIGKGIISGELDEKNRRIIPKKREKDFSCASCNKVNEMDAKFCSHCGAKLDFTIVPKEEIIEKSTVSDDTQELVSISKSKILGIFSLAIMFISTISYIVLMVFGFDYFFATIPFAVFLIAGTILGVKSSYYAVGKAGYALNTISLITIVIYIFTMLMWMI